MECNKTVISETAVDNYLHLSMRFQCNSVEANHQHQIQMSLTGQRRRTLAEHIGLEERRSPRLPSRPVISCGRARGKNCDDDRGRSGARQEVSRRWWCEIVCDEIRVVDGATEGDGGEIREGGRGIRAGDEIRVYGVAASVAMRLAMSRDSRRGCAPRSLPDCTVRRRIQASNCGRLLGYLVAV
jgi:hypothetical protein